MGILSLDPAFRNIGYSIWYNNILSEVGVIRPSQVNKSQYKKLYKSEEYLIQIHSIWHQLLNIVNNHRINLIISEAPGGSQSARAAKLLAFTLAIVGLLPKVTDSQLILVNERTAKERIFGKHKVTKHEVIDYVLSKYDKNLFPTVKKDLEHICDSIIVYEVGVSIFNQGEFNALF